MEKRKSKLLEHGQRMEQTRMRFGCCSLSITTPVRCSKRVARASELGSCQSKLSKMD